MHRRDSQSASRPVLALIISVALGAMAAIQIAAMTVILLFGRELPQFQSVLYRLSLIDWLVIYFLAGILLLAMRNLLRLRKSAVSWLLTYAGLGSWAALFYSFSPGDPPHFDEAISLGGLSAALLVLAYVYKLRQEGILK